MTDAVTVGQFLLGSSRKTGKRAGASAPVRELKRTLKHQKAPIPWRSARATAEQKIREALDIDLEDLLVSTWARSLALAKYLDPTKYPPDQTIAAHLAEHTVKARLKPTVEVLFNDQVVGNIPLDVTLSLLVKGGIVTIKGGRILSLATGTCQAKGKVAIAGTTIAEKKLQPLKLPGDLDFGKGREINPEA